MAHKSLNFDKPLLSVDGNPVPDPSSATPRNATLKGLLANYLMNHTTNEPIKYFNWALDLHKSGQLQLDEADETLLIKFIKESSTMNVLIKGRLLEVISNRDK